MIQVFIFIHFSTTVNCFIKIFTDFDVIQSRKLVNVINNVSILEKEFTEILRGQVVDRVDFIKFNDDVSI